MLNYFGGKKITYKYCEGVEAYGKKYKKVVTIETWFIANPGHKTDP